METTQTATERQQQDDAAAAFFRNTRKILEFDEVEAKSLSLEKDLAKVSEMWRRERDARRTAEAELGQLRKALRALMGE